MQVSRTVAKEVRSIVFSLFFIVPFMFMSTAANAAEDAEGGPFNPGDMIMHHITDAHEWEIAHGIVVPLPVIVYSEEKGLDIFSSSNFHDSEHNTVDYKGYNLDHGHISIAGSEAHVYDFSITKNVLYLFLNAAVMILIFFAVAKGYSRNKGGAPRGIQSFFEPIVIFVRDEIVKPNIGKNYEKYLPYMLTLFFFVWIGNIVGLTPAAANLTGNIAVTGVLALITLILTLFNSKKHYWAHIFNPPGVPLPLKPIIVPVEIIGIFTKPFSLMIRLFVAITAGHIVILSLLSLTFIFQSWAVGFGSTLIVLFINLIELLVAAIQAYVFTLFSSMYIGMAIEEAH